jgi:hypothetical protein
MNAQGFKGMLEKLEMRMKSVSQRIEALGILGKRLAPVPKKKLTGAPLPRVRRKLDGERLSL